jgi:integrase
MTLNWSSEDHPRKEMIKMGCIYRRKNSKHYWIKYYRNGKAYAESSYSEKQEIAKRLLKKREGEISQGRLPGICFERVSFDELARDLITDYRINKRKSKERAEIAVKHLTTFFGGMKVVDITTASIKEYIEKRMRSGLSNASINRELSALKRMLRLGSQCTPPKVGQVAYIPMLKESNTRKGFFDHNDFLALRNALPAYLKPVITFAYYTGWRRAEILNLTWDKVDLKEGVVRLDPGETKNNEARTLYLNEELLREMRLLHSKRRFGFPYVFHRDGHRIKDYRDAWRSACKKVGLQVRDEKTSKMIPAKLFHDFRRTAVRNMVRAGVHERVAMAISGHKTRSVFDRYNIISQDDLKDATQKQERYLQLHNGYSPGIPPNKKAPMEQRPDRKLLKLYGGSAWESNPPGTVLAPHTGFEVQEAHQ